MVKTDLQSVDEYIATHPKAVQTILRRVRKIIRKAVPGAAEVISYKIPTYKLHGAAVLFFAGWKEHYSLYPATEQVVKTFARDLAPYKLSKGTIRFPLSEPVPVKLIEDIAKLRVQEIVGLLTAKRATPKRATVKRVAKKRVTPKQDAAKRDAAKGVAAKRAPGKQTTAKRATAKRLTVKRTAAKRR